MIGHIAQNVWLCYNSSLTDGATLGNMHGLILPSLRRELADLRRIRESLNSVHLQNWIEGGFLEEELCIEIAIEAYEFRLRCLQVNSQCV